MRSNAMTVDGYINSFKGQTKEILKQIRRMILEISPNATETMKYRMPTYKIGSDVFAFAQQKNYLSIYINKEELISKHGSRIGKYSRGKNCIRYTKPGNINLSGIKKLINDAYREKSLKS
jgi:uncharacterized protein YdhG (YjbR/CyaY superfamily)